MTLQELEDLAAVLKFAGRVCKTNEMNERIHKSMQVIYRDIKLKVFDPRTDKPYTNLRVYP